MEPLQASLSALPHANIDPKEMHEKLIILFKHWFRSGNISKFDFLLHVRTLGLHRCNTQSNLQHRKQNCIFLVYIVYRSVHVSKIVSIHFFLL